MTDYAVSFEVDTCGGENNNKGDYVMQYVRVECELTLPPKLGLEFAQEVLRLVNTYHQLLQQEQA